jgi:hypothetical protein
MNCANAKAPGMSAEGLQEHQTNATSLPPLGDGCNGLTPKQDKLLKTTTAAFALRGHSVHELPDGGFLICKWNMHRPCSCLAELQAAARQMLGVV